MATLGSLNLGVQLNTGAEFWGSQSLKRVKSSLLSIKDIITHQENRVSGNLGDYPHKTPLNGAREIYKRGRRDLEMSPSIGESLPSSSPQTPARGCSSASRARAPLVLRGRYQV